MADAGAGDAAAVPSTSTSIVDAVPGCSTSFQERPSPHLSSDCSQNRPALPPFTSTTCPIPTFNKLPIEMLLEMEEYSNRLKKTPNGKDKEMTMERYFYLKYRQDLKKDEERREERKRKSLQEKMYREKKLKLMKLKISVLKELVKAVTKKRRTLF